MAAGATVNRALAEWLIIAFVLFAILLEFIIHKIEHWVLKRHPSMQIILRNLYRELMILGLISFAFIMYLFHNEPNPDNALTFEVAHIFVFLFAIFHSSLVALIVYMAFKMSNEWRNFERVSREEVSKFFTFFTQVS